jgi:DNA-damage-inducible protein I
MLTPKPAITVEGIGMLRVEVTIDKLNIKKFPAGYSDALAEELDKRLGRKFDEVDIKVRFAGADGLTVLGGVTRTKKRLKRY